jgi:glyoxylase-like metal-dependent hydrolase (beta-lactamase superfamily II)
MDVINSGPELSLIDIEPPGQVIRPGILGCYILKGEKTALVDPGPAASLNKLMSGLSILGIAPEEIDYILCTHIHLDHSGGLGAALKLMPNAMAVAHEKGINHLVNPTRLWDSSLQSLESVALGYGKPEPVDPDRLVTAREGMIIDLGGMRLEVLVTPGHASHHICFWENRGGRLFAGDSAGIRPRDTGILQPATPPPFDLKLSFFSLEKLISRHPREICYAHFGCYSGATSKLKEYRRLLLTWSRVVAKYLSGDFDWQLIYQDIQARHLSRTAAPNTSTNLPSDRFFTEHDIQGMWEYLRKAGTGILQGLE